MRFVDDGPDVPRELIVRQERGETVFVCGAGVSRTIGLPLFGELVEAVYQHLGEDWEHHPAEKEAMDTRQYDRVLRCLERRLAASGSPRNRSMRERVRSAVSTALAQAEELDLANHAALLALSRDAEGQVRLLTTNFDTLFERAWHQTHRTRIASHAGVALPQPRSANATGILHLHGRQADEQLDLVQTDVVLTSAEFGDAYLRTGWASRYVYDLARAETLVLVGYQADDPPMRYLLEALEADRERFPDLNRVYAFGECEIGDEPRARARWLAKGVEPILYYVRGHDHGALYSSLREWRRYADDPTAWRRERLRGLFGDHAGGPPSDAEAQICLPWLDRGDAAQLLADLSPPSAWLPILIQRGVFQPDALPAEWIASRLDDPDMIRACAALPQLDLATGWSIERALDRQRETLSPVRERAWRLLLVVKRARPGLHALKGRWLDGLQAVQRGNFDFETRDQVVGSLRPQLTIERPFRWPDDTTADEESLHRLLRLEFQPFDHSEPGELLAAWPDKVGTNAALLRALDRALVDVLERASDLGLLEGWDVPSRDVPSVAEHPQNRNRRGFYPITRMLADLWTRIARDDPNQARALTKSWQASPYLLVRRLALFAQASDLFASSEVAQTLRALDDHTLWVSGAQVEIMRLVTGHWARFSGEDRQSLEQRLQRGVPRSLFDEEALADADTWQTISDASIHRRLSRIVSIGGELAPESHGLLADIQARHPAWAPGADDRDDFPSWHEVRHGPDGHPELLAGIPDYQLVQEAFRIQVERRFEEGDLWRVFSAADPERALRGLVVEGDAGRWPVEAWRYLLWAAAEHEGTALQHAVSEQILRMREDALTCLLDSAASWIERRRVQLWETENGHSPFFQVWDRLAAIAYAQREPAKAHGGFADDLLSEALNRPGGHLASALLSAMDATKPTGGDLPPDFAPRFNLIVGAEQRAGLLGRVQLMRDLAYLDAIAPAWTAERLVPLLDWAHPEARSMWKAYGSGHIGSSRLFMALKPHLLAGFGDKGLSDDELEGLFGKLLQIAFWHLQDQGADYELTFGEMKRALTMATTAVRGNVAWQLWREMAADDRENNDRPKRWRTIIGPIFTGIWPLDAAARDPDVSQKLSLMALECGDAFPEAVEAILDVLVPYRLYQLAHAFRLETRHDALVAQHPLAFIRLVSALIDPALHPVPPDLPELLQACVAAYPEVAQDPAYLRLFGLRRQLGA
ncbi:SIR2 family protein [Cognatilysobacter tabacisoli]|uniref:SIR2 family protein n=1 Tax=Cognatilysobacter tabacisoli TaxID=2315424 RepID=UPI000E6AF0FE|nr:SIR2 family protein [Lysobacter tabacisoli]